MFVKKEFEIYGNIIQYLVDYPQGYNFHHQYPIIFYLHGYGFVNADLEYLSEHCPIRRERIPQNIPFVIVAPLCNETSWLFKFETVLAFFDYIVKAESCDKKRVYLCGSSMGAYSSWWFLLAKKETFAASVLCCGGGPYWAARLYGDLPVKIVHGAKDNTVLARESEIMAQRINQAGGTAELIIYDDLAHDVWTKTFTDVNTYKWMLLNEK